MCYEGEAPTRFVCLSHQMGAALRKMGPHLPTTVAVVHLWLHHTPLIKVPPILQRLHLRLFFHFTSSKVFLSGSYLPPHSQPKKRHQCPQGLPEEGSAHGMTDHQKTAPEIKLPFKAGLLFLDSMQKDASPLGLGAWNESCLLLPSSSSCCCDWDQTSDWQATAGFRHMHLWSNINVALLYMESRLNIKGCFLNVLAFTYFVILLLRTVWQEMNGKHIYIWTP